MSDKEKILSIFYKMRVISIFHIFIVSDIFSSDIFASYIFAYSLDPLVIEIEFSFLTENFSLFLLIYLLRINRIFYGKGSILEIMTKNTL